MKCTGEFKGVSINWGSSKHIIAFEINEPLTQEMVDSIKDSKLTIEVKKYREKRSLDANALLWACLGEIAKAMNPPADVWDIYLMMLRRYGKYTYICVKPNAVEAMQAQWRECEVVGTIDINGIEAVQLLCFFGSSTYDSKEFSVLLEGVGSEMVEMGLQPPPSKDMQRAIESVEKRMQKNEKHCTE